MLTDAGALGTQNALAELEPIPLIPSALGALGMPGRTVQRRLRERQLGYQQVLVEVRRALSQQMLGDLTLELHEIADYLGFNDQSAFRHAFRRWENAHISRVSQADCSSSTYSA